MSNIEISKINIDKTQLLIKDAQNRQDLTTLSTEVQSISTNLKNYLPLSGGTMTGNINLNDASMFFRKNGVNSGQVYSSGGNQVTLRNYSKESNYSEFFYTPVPNSDLTENKSYNILTTKNIVTTAQGGTGNANGTVAKLTTARTIRTNLASTTTASFDGSANVTPGVTGILPIANGGTNASTLPNARKSLFPTDLLNTPAEYMIGITQDWADGGFVKLPLPVKFGGTGADDVVNARKKLGYLGMFFAQSVNTDECTEIPANANLNTTTYTATGKYVCKTNAIAGTLTNKPNTARAFQMLVYNLLGATTGQLPSGSWESRTRIAMDYSGRIFISYVERASNGNYTWGAWTEIQQS